MEELWDSIKIFSFEIRHYQTIVAAVFGGVIAWKYNRSKHMLDHENAKRQLFTQLNERYDSLNDHLEKLVHLESETSTKAQVYGEKGLDFVWEDLFESDSTVQGKTITAAFDYLNLCSEQYYWYKKGFIDENVWICWKKGMQAWAQHSFFLGKIIKREKERKTVYYNDDFLDLFKD